FRQAERLVDDRPRRTRGGEEVVVRVSGSPHPLLEEAAIDHQLALETRVVHAVGPAEEELDDRRERRLCRDAGRSGVDRYIAAGAALQTTGRGGRTGDSAGFSKLLILAWQEEHRDAALAGTQPRDNVGEERVRDVHHDAG